METHASTASALERLWDVGQQHLVAGRYVSARQYLEGAESIAWRRHDARALARVYLPLLEARRQIRQNASDGLLVITTPHQPRRALADLPPRDAATLLFAGPSAARAAAAVQYAARRQHACLEVLILIAHGGATRLASLADPTFAAGLAVRTTTDPADLIEPRGDGQVTVPLPPAGVYAPGEPLHGVARESLVVAWEALALRWQARHPVHAEPWDELAWQRLALRIDPAREPAAMRIIALAEEIERIEPAVQPPPRYVDALLKGLPPV